MQFPGISRRGVVAATLAATLAAAVALPCANALAAPFTSTRLTVRIEGSGPDVILIPGFNSSPRTWASTVAAMPGYRFHLVHLAGFAGQPAGANGAGPVLGPVAEEIVRYIKVAGLKRPAIVGHSMGGTLGLMIAARHPDVLSRLMVVDMMPYLGAVFAPPGAGRDQVQAIAERIGAGMAGADAEQRRAGAIATMDAMVDNVAMRMVGVEDSVASDPVVSSHVYPELLKTDLGPELARITVPLTVLYVQPKSVPMTEAQFDAAYKGWYATVPNVTFKRMSESAHFIMWDQPARFQAALKAFLDPAGAAGT